jgi:hypothetical protein
MAEFEVAWEETSDIGIKETTRGGSIYIKKSDFVFEEFLQEIIIPLCKSIGYTDKTIDKYFGGL